MRACHAGQNIGTSARLPALPGPDRPLDGSGLVMRASCGTCRGNPAMMPSPVWQQTRADPRPVSSAPACCMMPDGDHNQCGRSGIPMGAMVPESDACAGRRRAEGLSYWVNGSQPGKPTGMADVPTWGDIAITAASAMGRLSLTWQFGHSAAATALIPCRAAVATTPSSTEREATASSVAPLERSPVMRPPAGGLRWTCRLRHGSRCAGRNRRVDAARRHGTSL